MVTLEKIHSSLFPNRYDSFLIDADPLSSEQDWRILFDYQWDTEEGHCGYALLDKGKVVGMLGMVFSERTIDGAVRKFCNLHTWWVLTSPLSPTMIKSSKSGSPCMTRKY